MAAVSLIDRAWEHIMRDDVAFAHKGKHATTTLHYSRQGGETLYEVCKEYGSELVFIPTASRDLKRFLDANM